MSDPHPNPFPDDADRHAIWETLMRRDFQAFIAADWSMVAGDFAPGFFGIDAGKQPDPDRWAIRFPDLATYRAEWLRQAEEFKPVEFEGVDKLTFFLEGVELTQIDIAGDHALAHKKFNGQGRTTAGEDVAIRWQTLYKMLRHDGRWKIATFVGYLPFDLGAAAP